MWHEKIKVYPRYCIKKCLQNTFLWQNEEDNSWNWCFCWTIISHFMFNFYQFLLILTFLSHFSFFLSFLSLNTVYGHFCPYQLNHIMPIKHTFVHKWHRECNQHFMREFLCVTHHIFLPWSWHHQYNASTAQSHTSISIALLIPVL